uniref:prolyl oligopeptidase n=1 Tax=Roseihalotalea indica TaxID=2867963 RepID=A0AA49GQK8_9BACT|nr:prolyl oligopeptidase family serine peptidase [Tunicatimonas sp. TK19036]
MNVRILIWLVFMSSQLLAQYRLDSSYLAPPKPVYEQYFGKTVEDPYRYLEDLEDADVRGWLKAQNEHSQNILSRISGRDSLLTEIQAWGKEEKVQMSFPRAVAGRLFYIKTLTAEDKEVLYYRSETDGKEISLFDTQTYSQSKGVHSATIDYFEPSPTGSLVAFGVSEEGAEMATLHVIRVDDQTMLPEAMERAMYGNPSWLPDESGFFYSQMKALSDSDPPSEKYQDSKVWLHRLNTPVESDQEVFSRRLQASLPLAAIDFPFPVLFPTSSDLFIYVYRGVADDLTLYKAPLANVLAGDNSKLAWQSIFTMEDEVTDFAVWNDALFLLTHKNAPTFKVVKTTLLDSDISRATTLIDQGEAVIEDIHLSGETLLVQSTKNGLGQLTQLEVETDRVSEISLPFEGSVFFPGKFFSYGSDLFFKMTSWNHPIDIYRLDGKSNQVEETPLQPQPQFPLLEELVVEELEVPSHDGVMVPLSLVYHRDTKKDGNNMTLLRGYGAYGVSFNPVFESYWLSWFQRGGIYAIAHVRGGGERGEAWHQAGLKATKPNSWKDFIACAEYLIQEKYTSKEILAAYSASAGGITIGRAITERPDLFQAAMIRVGAMNPLRHEFTQNTANIPEYGTIQDSLEFYYLYEMDPYHHVSDGVTYPAMLFTAGINDARLPAWLPGKMVAQLQQATSRKRPVLLRIDYEGGHFGGAASQQEQELADLFSFLLWQLRHPDFAPKAY